MSVEPPLSPQHNANSVKEDKIPASVLINGSTRAGVKEEMVVNNMQLVPMLSANMEPHVLNAGQVPHMSVSERNIRWEHRRKVVSIIA